MKGEKQAWVHTGMLIVNGLCLGDTSECSIFAFDNLDNYSQRRMEPIRIIPKEQIVMAFVATCIEATARLTGNNYHDIFQRMNHVGMIENYILQGYEALHSESREVVVDRLMECLNNWEEKQLCAKSF